MPRSVVLEMTRAMVTRRIPDPKIGGSNPSGVNFFTTRRHRVRVVKEVDLLGSARASANLVDVVFFLVIEPTLSRTC